MSEEGYASKNIFMISYKTFRERVSIEITLIVNKLSKYCERLILSL